MVKHTPTYRSADAIQSCRHFLGCAEAGMVLSHHHEYPVDVGSNIQHFWVDGARAIDKNNIKTLFELTQGDGKNRGSE